MDKRNKSTARNNKRKREAVPRRKTIKQLTENRSAKELGITWLDARCEDSPITKAHHFVASTVVDEGSVYECMHCHRVEWLPNSLDACMELSRNMNIYGLDLAYQKMLDDHPAAKRLMTKIQDIYYLRKALPDVQFHLALASIVMDREYPYDAVVEEDEML